MLRLSSREPIHEKKDLEAKLARFAPVELTADISKLPEGDQKALAKIIQASKYMDDIFCARCGAATWICKKT